MSRRVTQLTAKSLVHQLRHKECFNVLIKLSSRLTRQSFAELFRRERRIYDASIWTRCFSHFRADTALIGTNRLFQPAVYIVRRPNPVNKHQCEGSDYDSTYGLISEWNVTVSSVAPGGVGNVSGTVRVPSPAQGCPDVAYTATGTISPSSQTDNVTGSTPFSWTAISPNPSSACGGYTPVSTMTYAGTITNKSNDRGTGTWTRGGASGPLTFWRQYIDPIGETTFGDGFGTVPETVTMARFRQELTRDVFGPPDPNSNLFQGRQVYEETGSGGADGCYNASGGMYPGPAFTVVKGSVWNVGYASGLSGNTWGWDVIGWPPAGVQWYRDNLSSGQLPCSATIPQIMKVVVNGTTNGSIVYKQHNLQVVINAASLQVTRDGITQSSNQ